MRTHSISNTISESKGGSPIHSAIHAFHLVATMHDTDDVVVVCNVLREEIAPILHERAPIARFGLIRAPSTGRPKVRPRLVELGLAIRSAAIVNVVASIRGVSPHVV